MDNSSEFKFSDFKDVDLSLLSDVDQQRLEGLRYLLALYFLWRAVVAFRVLSSKLVVEPEVSNNG